MTHVANTQDGLIVLEDAHGNVTFSQTHVTYLLDNGNALVATSSNIILVQDKDGNEISWTGFLDLSDPENSSTSHTISFDTDGDGTNDTSLNSQASTVTNTYENGRLVSVSAIPALTVSYDGNHTYTQTQTQNTYGELFDPARISTTETSSYSIHTKDGTESWTGNLVAGAPSFTELNGTVSQTRSSQTKNHYRIEQVDGRQIWALDSVSTPQTGISISQDAFGNLTLTESVQTFEIEGGGPRVQTVTNKTRTKNTDGHLEFGRWNCVVRLGTV